MRAGKYQMVTLAGQKIEVFIGQTNHFNTLAVDALAGPRELADLSGFTSNLLGERLDEQGNARPREDLDDLDARSRCRRSATRWASCPIRTGRNSAGTGGTGWRRRCTAAPAAARRGWRRSTPGPPRAGATARAKPRTSAGTA